MVIVQQGPLLAMFPSVTHVVQVERNKNMEKKGGVGGGEGEGGRETEREREGRGGRENGEK